MKAYPYIILDQKLDALNRDPWFRRPAVLYYRVRLLKLGPHLVRIAAAVQGPGVDVHVQKQMFAQDIFMSGGSGRAENNEQP